MAVDEPLVGRQAGRRRIVAEVVVRHTDRAVARHGEGGHERRRVAGLVDPRERRPRQPAVRRLREDHRAVDLPVRLRAAEAVAPDDVDVAVARAARVEVGRDQRQEAAGANAPTRVRVARADGPVRCHLDRVRPGRTMIGRAHHHRVVARFVAARSLQDVEHVDERSVRKHGDLVADRAGEA